MLALSVRRLDWGVPLRETAAARVTTTYCRTTGVELLQAIGYQSKSDRYDDILIRRSPDNGAHWSPPTPAASPTTRDGVTLRTRLAYWLDTEMDRLVQLRALVALAGDEVRAGFRFRRFFYAVSCDGGLTMGPSRQVREEGPEFDGDHPVAGIWYGKNSYIYKAPIKLAPRNLLLPLHVFPLDAGGDLYNPYDTFTFTDLQFLHGTWNPEGTAISWRSTDPIRVDPARSMRGLMEPAIARLQGERRLLCICRGSNGLAAEAPCRQWLLHSQDDGWTWSPPRPLTWSDDTPLDHPSSHSALLRHSNGRLYWFGNAVELPATGNAPRYPLVVAEVDERRLGLLRATAVTIDTRHEGDSPELQLSNFQVYEDRMTGEMVLTLARLFANGRQHPTSGATKYLLSPG